jgi:DNA-binding NarL/FixJ family response regulator
VRRVREAVPGAAVVVFSRSLDVKLARAAVDAGARGFLHAGMSPEQIVRGVSVAARGELALPRGLLEGLIAEQRGPDLSGLSPRQREIVGLVAEGLSNAEIARRLYLSVSTVKQHLRKAYKTLGVTNRREAAAALLRGDG